MVKQGLRSTVHLIQRFIILTRWQSACFSISPFSLFFFYFYLPKFEFFSFSPTSTGGTQWCFHCFTCLGYSCGPFSALIGWPTTPDAVYRSHDMFQKLQPHIHSNNSSVLEVRFCLGFSLVAEQYVRKEKEKKTIISVCFLGKTWFFFFFF